MRAKPISLDESSLYEFGKRVAMLRHEKGLKQTEFACELAAFCGYDSPIPITSISSWEQSRRFPMVKMIVAIAMFYNVSCDYLFGLTDERSCNNKNIMYPTEITEITNADIPINMIDYPSYDGKPVFVTFKNSAYINQWGIMDATNNRAICRDFTVDLNHNTNCYAQVTPTPLRKRIISLGALYTHEYVWIEMICQDQGMRSLYNGRYTHSPQKDCLVKIDDGRPLPYAGLDLSYWAFAE